MNPEERADKVMEFFQQHPDADIRDGIMFAIAAAETDARNRTLEECAKIMDIAATDIRQRIR